MNNSLFQKILHGLIVIGFGCIVVTGGMAAFPKYRQANDLNAEKDRILRRIEEKTREINEIRARQRRFNTDREFVEQLARQNRRVYPGELVFVFED